MDQMKPTPEFERALEDLRCAEAMLLDAKQRLALEGHRMYVAANPPEQDQEDDDDQEPQILKLTRPKIRPGQRYWGNQEDRILKGVYENAENEGQAVKTAARVLGRTIKSIYSRVYGLKKKGEWDKLEPLSQNYIREEVDING